MECTLETLEVYQMAEEFSDPIWNTVNESDYFVKDTIGKQLVRAADSISANIAEGYGRYYYKESKQFYFYARGSIQETKSWLSKCNRRSIIDKSVCSALISEAEKIMTMLNAFIKFVVKSQQKTKAKESNSHSTST